MLVIFIFINSSFAKFQTKLMEKIVILKDFKIWVFNLFMSKLFKINSQECEYHSVTITEANLKRDHMVKTFTFISQKNPQ